MNMRRTGPERRRQGKSGQVGSSENGSVRDAIVNAAATLFADRGYADTTITEIAAKAGLQQSSFYYYYSSKEEILRDTLALNREALTYARELVASDVPVTVKLYQLLYYDTIQLCLSAFDFNEIERLAAARSEEFSEFWTDYRQLHKYVQDLVADGIASGEFKACDAELTATAALCLNEGIQKRYRGKNHHDCSPRTIFAVRTRTAQEYAEMSATTSVTAILSAPSRLSKLLRNSAF